MPDPLPARPDFDFFAAPDVSTDRDEGDENVDPFDAIKPLFGSRPDMEYPTRDNDFELREIDRLQAQIDAALGAYRAAYKALITDNPWRVAEVRAGLREIGAALGVEE